MIASMTSKQNESFCEKIASVQYKATLTITSAIQSTSRNQIYQELGLESLKTRRWHKHLVCMIKIMNEKAPNYLINLIPKYEPTIRTRNNSIPSYKYQTNCFKHSFFPSTLNDWFNLYINMRNSIPGSCVQNHWVAFMNMVKTVWHFKIVKIFLFFFLFFFFKKWNSSHFSPSHWSYK